MSDINWSAFDITIPDESAPESKIYDSAAPRGLGMGAHATDPDKFGLAEHNNFNGMLLRDVETQASRDAHLLQDIEFGRTSSVPTPATLPYLAGNAVSSKRAKQVECEGVDLLVLSGTGALDTNTAVPSNVSMFHGRWRITQSGEQINGTLAANNLGASDGSSLRVRIDVML